MRVLLAVVGITLVLPAGWCCAVSAALVPNQPKPPQPTPNPNAGGCPRCLREVAKTEPQPDPEPDRKPTPAPMRCGECCDRDLATPRDSDRSAAVSALPVAFLPVAGPVSGSVIVPVDLAQPPTGPPLHVRLCVWLC